MSTLMQLYKRYPRIKKIRHSRIAALDKAPQKKGVCVKIRIMKPKKPNSAQRKIVRVRLVNQKMITAYIPGRGHNLQEHSVVLVRVGRIPDLPGVKYKLIKGKYDFNWKEKEPRNKRRSKFGIPKNYKTLY